MAEKTNPTSEEAVDLILILLGRHPSEAALRELMGRPLLESAERIIAGREFCEMLSSRLDGSAQLPQVLRKVVLSDAKREWLCQVLFVGGKHNKIFPQQSWEEVLGTILQHAGLAERVRRIYADRTYTDILNKWLKQFGNPPSASRHGSNSKKQVKTVGSKPTASPTLASDSSTIMSSAEVVPTVASEGTVYTDKRSEWKVSTSALVPRDFTILRSEYLAKAEVLAAALIRSREADDINTLLATCLEKDEPGVMYALEVHESMRAADPIVLAYVSLYLAKLNSQILRRETAYSQLSELLFSGAIDLLRPSDQRKARRYYAYAALRVGRVEDATRAYHSILLDDPTDWDAHFVLGDIYRNVDPDQAASSFLFALQFGGKMPTPKKLSAAEFLYYHGFKSRAVEYLADIMRKTQTKAEESLCFANFALDRNDKAVWRGSVARFFSQRGLASSDIHVQDNGNLFEFGLAHHQRIPHGPKVSIIMTCFNAAETIRSAARSVLNQTFQHIELLIVDDCSTDNSRDIIRTLALSDSRVKIIHNGKNYGTYYAKNRGIQSSAGDFVTFHDSDDWMHPQRVEFHLSNMQSGVAATTSKWIRMTQNGRVMIQKGGAYIHTNPASTFMRKQVFEQLGFFDSVRTGADTEMLMRMRLSYGSQSVAELDGVLAVGLHHQNSLTQSGPTAFDEHRYSPLRVRYWEEWSKWHYSSIISGNNVYISFPQAERPFEAPSEITVGA